MKKTLLIMVMALAVLLTQCRKPEVKFPTPSASEGVTVSMTVTAGPGSKTDINTETGAITWSEKDKLYVGFDGKYVGYLTLTRGQNTPTGWFSGNVTLPNGTTDDQTFGFFYLGNAKDYSNELTEGTSATVDVSFATQEIYADANSKLANASKYHIGYGSANGTVKDGVVTGINVTLVSKVALARFSFKKGGADYTGELTLSGTNIYKEMTVNFAGTFTGKTTGNITLTAGHSERYVMLVPVSTESETLSFAGEGFEGSTTLGSGIEPNNFYGRDGAIEVPVKPFVFTVGMDGETPRTVKFAPGNLYYDGSTFHFESNQYDFRTYEGKNSCINGSVEEDGTPSGHWGLFGWSTGSTTYGMSTSTSYDAYMGNFKDWGKNAIGTDAADTWRTLKNDEWVYLLNTSNSASGARTDANRFAKAMVSGVAGLLVFPDGYMLPKGYTTDGGGTGMAKVNKTNAAYPTASIPSGTWASMESSGAVFLPAAGNRNGENLNSVGSYGDYWSSTLNGPTFAYRMNFNPTNTSTSSTYRCIGVAVRLVRSAE